MDQSQPFGFDPEFPHPREQLDDPGCGIDGIGPTLRPEGMNGCGEKIRRRPRDLVPGNGFLRIGIHTSRSESSIGRIEDGRRKGLRLAEEFRVADVPLADLDLSGETVENDIPFRDGNEVVLDVDPQNPPATDAPGQDQGDDPASRSQIDQVIPFPEDGKMGQKDGIDRKTVAPLLLDDPEAAFEDLIDRLPVP